MASVYKHRERWYLRYRDHRGKWRSKATSAQSKTEAKRMAQELGMHHERQRIGLEAHAAEDGGGTLAELMKWWLKVYSSKQPSHDRNVSTIEKHLLDGPIGQHRLDEIPKKRGFERQGGQLDQQGGGCPQLGGHRHEIGPAVGAARRAWTLELLGVSSRIFVGDDRHPVGDALAAHRARSEQETDERLEVDAIDRHDGRRPEAGERSDVASEEALTDRGYKERLGQALDEENPPRKKERRPRHIQVSVDLVQGFPRHP
jgi:hypothetical protein